MDKNVCCAFLVIRPSKVVFCPRCLEFLYTWLPSFDIRHPGGSGRDNKSSFMEQFTVIFLAAHIKFSATVAIVIVICFIPQKLLTNVNEVDQIGLVGTFFCSKRKQTNKQTKLSVAFQCGQVRKCYCLFE